MTHKIDELAHGAGETVETIYDWLTVAVFAGLVVLFLQRSTAETPQDRLIEYAPPAIACAASNYAGNHGYAIVAIGLIVAALAFVWFVLKPFPR